MDGPTLKSLPPFSTIGMQEKNNVIRALKRPLSGYLGGKNAAGYWVERLADEWRDTFGAIFAIPCNSATSGLLAACMAAGVRHGDTVWTSPYTMSATAACAMVLGARVEFIDIEPVRYSINLNMLSGREPPKAIIVTNLFGHPAYLAALRSWCDHNHVVMIEDNAQSIYAREGEHFTGTIGHMGVFSLNVHKHIQAGEGGVVCTNIDGYHWMLKSAINHGELSEGYRFPGLNLRMTEPTAAIACAQLNKLEEIIKSRVHIAHALTDMVKDIPWIKPQVADVDCTHSYYVWSARVPYLRRRFCSELQLRGFPLREGYIKPLHHLFQSSDRCPETDRIESDIVTFEVCAYDPKAHHLRRMQEIVDYVAGAIDRRGAWISQTAQ